ncbi:MAG: hypothetical protein EOO62_29780, partial [Hymenobacter sp.]
MANNTATVTYTAPGVFSANVVDVVGYTVSASNIGTNAVNAYEGSAPAVYLNNTTSAIVRASGGCTDTNNNSADFTGISFSNNQTAPRNSSTTANNCPNPVLVANPSALNFSAPTGQAATVATYTLTGFNLAANAPIAISSGDPSVLVSTTGTLGSFTRTASVTTTASGTLTQTVTVRFTAPATVGTTTTTISNMDANNHAAPVTVLGSAVMAYTWNGATSTSYNTPANWTPTRTTPSNADILVFDGASTPMPTVVLDYAAAQTVGQLLFSNNVSATLSTDDSRTLTLDNNLPGDDFTISTGSIVTIINNTNAAAVGL